MSDTHFEVPRANFLADWRQHRGLSQEKLGEMVGTTGSVISLLESGRRQLSPKWLRKLAPALGTTPGHLLEHHPDDIPSEVLDVWGAIPEDQRQQALAVLKTFTRAA
ncbi:MAG: helix-turn-helix domain-containing protein [Brevundimonas sp.]|uniref:helix-turn-helix domain-containing protein n=1 Tax=Brevundimonas sp. TaxID=1871086 RepID=UPI00391CBF37